jgi:hypothetical protein
MPPRAVIFSYLFDRQSFVAQVRELDKLFLNLLQPFVPLDMSDLRLCSVLAPKAMPIIQCLNVRNLRPKTRNLFPKDFNVIHRT